MQLNENVHYLSGSLLFKNLDATYKQGVDWQRITSQP